MMRRSVILVLAFVCGLLVASVSPATADDTITPGPTSQPGDPFGGQTVPPGPVFVITPGNDGTQLPPSSDPEDVKAQIEKDKNNPSSAPSGTPTAGVTDDPQTPAAQTPAAPGANQGKSDSADGSGAWWWAVAAGGLAVVALVVVLLVARRRRDRARSASLNRHAS